MFNYLHQAFYRPFSCGSLLPEGCLNTLLDVGAVHTREFIRSDFQASGHARACSSTNRNQNSPTSDTRCDLRERVTYTTASATRQQEPESRENC